MHKKNFLFTAIVFCLVAGAIVGAVLANLVNAHELEKITSELKNFLGTKNIFFDDNHKLDRFASECVKHARVIIFLWLMNFVSLGKFFGLFVIFYRGLAYGFTSSLLFNAYKSRALVYIAKYILPESLILVPTIILMAYVNFSSTPRNKIITLENTFVLSVALLSIFLCIILEFYLLV